MRLSGFALLLLGLTPVALAQDLPRTVTGDIDGDGVADRVELRPRQGDPAIDAFIFLSASKRTINAYQLVRAESAETLAIDAKGELHLAFGWLSRCYKSRLEFYIGMQGGALVVRRYRYAVADGLAPAGDDKVRFCEIDFVANYAQRNGKPADPPGLPIAVEKWNVFDVSPAACESLF